MKMKPHNARNIFADNIRAIRIKKGLSQEKLASISGLHRTYVGSVERKERNISIDNIERIARALETDIGNLFEL